VGKNNCVIDAPIMTQECINKIKEEDIIKFEILSLRVYDCHKDNVYQLMHFLHEDSTASDIIKYQNILLNMEAM